MQNDVELTMTERKQTIGQAVAMYSKQLLGFIRTKVGSDADAEDVLQDVWYQYSNLEEVDAIESVSGWLYRVARNKITDRFRKKRTESLDDQAFENEEGELYFKDQFLSDTQTPEDAFFKKVFWEELMSALDELPEKQRQVFIQNELEDKSLQEIANETGENIKTVISRKGYAVKYLRERLNGLYNDFLNY